MKKDTPVGKGADHSNSMGDQHSMYNQNTGRETWIGQGLPQRKGGYCEQTVENEGKTSRCEEKPVGDLGGRASPPQSSETKWVDDSPAGVPKNVKDESKQDRKGRHAQKMAFFEYLLEDLSKTEENMFGAGQRGLGHDKGSIQGSGDSVQITPVKEKKKSDFCPNCGKEITERQHKDYPETQAKGAYCPTCRQNKQIKERDAKDDAKMESITAGIHRDLAGRGQKVTRFSAGKKPKTYN